MSEGGRSTGARPVEQLTLDLGGAPSQDVTAVGDELADEQSHLDRVFARVDELTLSAEQRLRRIQGGGATGTPQSRSERDAFAQSTQARLAQLNGVQDRLVFGRMDLQDGQRHHIGRIGLSDQDQHKLLVDWRAPVAAPFYQATPAAPGEVVRRRHLTTRGRSVVHLEDEVLDLSAISPDQRGSLRGEGALMAAVTAPRTGRMGDIVATIQAEQDRIVRDDLAGVLVVQGGPGTGKTAVALHRAAYLLFTYRQRLERSGVLVVGPGPLFLRYIERVLPSLGETGVVMVTPATLFPGVLARDDDRAEVAALKGDLRMAELLSRAVRDRQLLPEADLELKVGSHRLVLTRAAVAASRSRARATGAPHNAARVTFVKDMLRHLAGLLAQSLGLDPEEAGRSDLDADLRDARDVRVNLNLLWMPLSPARFLDTLLSTPYRLDRAGAALTASERDLLRREPGTPWTVADVPLLDELAELIGDDGEAARVRAHALASERAAEMEYAQGVLQMSRVSSAVVSAEMLSGQFRAQDGPSTVVERAEADRTWAFGHLVVDEAQELSPMQWRLLARRCPSRSWTVVGDLAQRASDAGATSWGRALDHVASGRVRVRELTVNYRTPQLVMAVADAVAAEADLPVTPVVSVREGTHPPTRVQRGAGDPGAVVRVVQDLVGSGADGTVGVIAPAGELDALLAALRAALPQQVGDSVSSLGGRVSVLSAAAAKGLEFDDVVVVEPAALVGASRRGPSDLYVALSRPTRQLVVVHHDPLPAGMGGVQPC